MTTVLNIADALASITGPEHVLPGDAITVSPASTQQVSEVLRFANENRLSVTPIGGGTKQTWGNAVRADIHLCLARLNRVIEHPWQDLTCTVQAGCTWQHMQQTLAQHGQFVALDPLWPDRATVGGILATNDSGALRHRYGNLRDLVIGMTLVLADGTIARSGGKVVKNVAGYDLPKLMTGSLGTLAVITEATFRLHPLPQHTQTFTVSAPQAAQLAPLMQSIRASHLLTQSLQLRGDSSGFHLDIKLDAHPEAHQEVILQKMVASAGFKLESSSVLPLTSVDPKEIVILSEAPEPAEELASASHIAPQRDNGGSSGLQTAESRQKEIVILSEGPLGPQSKDLRLSSVWQARESLFRDNATIIKLSTLPSELCAFIERMHSAPDLTIACVAQSSGLIYAALEGELTAIENYLSTIKTDLTIFASSTNAAHWKASPNTLPLMQAVKHQFDPNRVLNPGRLIGGI